MVFSVPIIRISAQGVSQRGDGRGGGKTTLRTGGGGVVGNGMRRLQKKIQSGTTDAWDRLVGWLRWQFPNPMVVGKWQGRFGGSNAYPPWSLTFSPEKLPSQFRKGKRLPVPPFLQWQAVKLQGCTYYWKNLSNISGGVRFRNHQLYQERWSISTETWKTIREVGWFGRLPKEMMAWKF